MAASKLPLVDSETNAELAYFVTIFSLLGAIVLVIFGTLQIVIENNPLLGFLEIAGGVAMGLNVFAFRITRNVAIARLLLLAAIVAFLLIMFITGGTRQTGVFWYFIFPVAAFFLCGRIGGILWIGLLYGLTILLFTLAQLNYMQIAYDPVTVRQLLVSLFITSFAIYVYQRVRETAHTATTQSRHDLQTERSRAEAIVDTMDEGVIAVDTQANITFVNKSAEQLLSKPQHDLVGHNFLESVPLESDEGGLIVGIQHPLLKLLKTQAKNTVVVTFVRTDGSKLALAVSFAPIISEEKLVGAVAGLRDITEERQIDRAKSEFVTIASHQLRTPISAISWFAEMMLGGDTGKLTKEQLENVERIHQSSTRMARLVSEMLIVSSLELGSLPIRPVPTNIASVAHAVLKEQLAFIHDVKVPKIKEQYDKDLPDIPVDTDVIKSILHHIITNALKYTRENGSVSIEITKDTHKHTRSSKGSVVIIVSDNGYGIPKNAQPKIFSKFFRAENIKDKDTDGTGLGMYIVKALLDYVDGTISFTSEESQGTTFVVRIPLEGMTAKS